MASHQIYEYTRFDAIVFVALNKKPNKNKPLTKSTKPYVVGVASISGRDLSPQNDGKIIKYTDRAYTNNTHKKGWTLRDPLLTHNTTDTKLQTIWIRTRRSS